MRIQFEGTADEIQEEMVRYLSRGGEASDTVTAAMEGRDAVPAATKTKSPSKAAIAKAKDLATKAVAAEGAPAPSEPAAPGESAAASTPVPPDGRMARPACERHAAGLDTTKFRPLIVTADRCVQCVTEKVGGKAPAAAPAAPKYTADDVKAALNAVGDAQGDDRIFEILAAHGAESVSSPEVDASKHLDPKQYEAVIDFCHNLLNPPAAPKSAKARL